MIEEEVELVVEVVTGGSATGRMIEGAGTAVTSMTVMVEEMTATEETVEGTEETVVAATTGSITGMGVVTMGGTIVEAGTNETDQKVEDPLVKMMGGMVDIDRDLEVPFLQKRRGCTFPPLLMSTTKKAEGMVKEGGGTEATSAKWMEREGRRSAIQVDDMRKKNTNGARGRMRVNTATTAETRRTRGGGSKAP
mmetsp:Transcript_39401/g.100996  ORF Transcript_39401/g.100996 Transcript_39401/m.100996 type:complete len:194 (+) Transcript_39401:362-943(+)